LAEKPEIVALTKADALDPAALREQTARLKRAAKATPPYAISSASGQGVEDVLRALLRAVDVTREREAPPAPAEAWRP
jgi:GTP-binding protein